MVGWVFALRHSNSISVIQRWSVSLLTCSWAGLDPAVSRFRVHILLPVTHNCPSWISGRGRITIEIISWSIFKKVMSPGCGSNTWTLDLQSGMLPTVLRSPALFLVLTDSRNASFFVHPVFRINFVTILRFHLIPCHTSCLTWCKWIPESNHYVCCHVTIHIFSTMHILQADAAVEVANPCVNALRSENKTKFKIFQNEPPLQDLR